MESVGANGASSLRISLSHTLHKVIYCFQEATVRQKPDPRLNIHEYCITRLYVRIRRRDIHDI